MFIKCINGHLEGGGNGFSQKCPWSTIVPVMSTGIEMTMAAFSGLQWGDIAIEADEILAPDALDDPVTAVDPAIVAALFLPENPI